MSGSATPIVSIPVDDAAFKRFHDLFQKYEASVKKLPDAWASIEGHLKGMGGHLERMTRALEGNARSVKRTTEDVGAWSRFMREIRFEQVRVEESFARIGLHIRDATSDLFKWSRIFTGISGLLGVGGLWGLNRLAGSAAGQLRNARGLGVTTAEAQAFSVNYGRAVDTGAVLEGIADAQSDYQKRVVFGQLGIGNYQNRDAAQLAPEMIERARRMYLASDRSQQYAEAHGLLSFGLTMADLRRLGAMDDREFNKMRGGMAEDTQRFGLNPAFGRKWQDFVNQMERAGTVLENSFIKVLIGLQTPLTTFSERLAELVQHMEPRLKEWVDALGRGLERFADYLGSDKFKDDAQSVASGIAGLAEALKKFLSWFSGARTPDGRLIAPSGVPFFQPAMGPMNAYSTELPFGPSSLPGGAPNDTNPGNLRVPGSTTGFQRFSSREEGVRAMTRQLLLYQDRDHLDTIRAIVSKYAPSSENDTDAYIRTVVGRSRFEADTRLNLHDPDTMARIESAMLYVENRNKNADLTPNVLVTINNNTGGSAVVSTSQVASVPR